MKRERRVVTNSIKKFIAAAVFALVFSFVPGTRDAFALNKIRYVRISNEYHPKFTVTLFAQKAIVEPEDSYFEPTCACCEFCHIE